MIFGVRSFLQKLSIITIFIPENYTFIREYYTEGAHGNSVAGDGKASTNGEVAQKEGTVRGSLTDHTDAKGMTKAKNRS
jgi:hypothetical protein